MVVTLPSDPNASQPHGVLIAGGGVAALEAALSIRELAGDAAHVTILTNATDIIVRPLTPRAPFDEADEVTLELAPLVAATGATLVSDRLARVNVEDRTVSTDGEATLPYDALLVAVGAGPRVRHALATDVTAEQAAELGEALLGRIDDGSVRRATFIVPARASWPLPLYELLLRAAEHARSAAPDATLRLVTAESAPLASMGKAISADTLARLEALGITVLVSSQAAIADGGLVTVSRGGSKTELASDVVYSLPEVRGPETPGLPRDQYGHLPVDRFGRVRRSDRVFAVGDAADGQLKLAGLAAAQASAVSHGLLANAELGLLPRPAPVKLPEETPRLAAFLAQAVRDAADAAPRS